MPLAFSLGPGSFSSGSVNRRKFGVRAQQVGELPGQFQPASNAGLGLADVALGIREVLSRSDGERSHLRESLAMRGQLILNRLRGSVAGASGLDLKSLRFAGSLARIAQAGELAEHLDQAGQG